MTIVALLVLVGVYAVRAAPAITVHLVPHSHQDVGWLKTADQYYYGSNDTLHHSRGLLG